jgi:predicted peroxiredoxin
VKLGILVNTAKHLEDVIGLTEAALARGREVIVFAMDEGTRLVNEPAFASLAALEGVTLSICEHSAKVQGLDLERLAPQIRCGSQLNNAMMAHAADRMVVL